MTVHYHRSVSALLISAASLTLFLVSCSQNQVPRFGIGGRYEEGREQFLRGRGGDMDRAIDALEYVVSKDPTYKNSLMYLGRAYYRKGRFQEAHAILQRAVALNREDEQAWIAYGLTQLRVGQIDKGLESLKGGITLASKVMVDGYHNYLYWDTRGVIRAGIRRSAFLLTRGAEEKDNIIQATDRLLAEIDNEENFQRNTYRQNTRHLYGGSP
ncbi:MAG TPA: tetratricopeptide repeat protein [Candidatus Binatia bacterium]|nr:tetratricopeptide repeat protein [Candidatus Binatia bacterium]